MATDARQSRLSGQISVGHPESILQTASEHNCIDSAACSCTASLPFSLKFDNATGQATVIPRDGASVLVQRVSSAKLVFLISLPSTLRTDIASPEKPAITQLQAVPTTAEAHTLKSLTVSIESETLQPVSAAGPAAPPLATGGEEPLQFLTDASKAAFRRSPTARVQTQTSVGPEQLGWSLPEQRTAAALPNGANSLSTPAISTCVNPDAAPARPLMLPPVSMRCKASLAVKVETPSSRGSEASSPDESRRRILDGSVTPTAQGSNGVVDYKVSLSKKRIADAQEAAQRATRGLHVDIKLKDVTVSPRREPLRPPPGIPIDSRTSPIRSATDWGNGSDTGGSQQDQSSPPSLSQADCVDACNFPWLPTAEGAANGDNSHRCEHELGRPPGLHAAPGCSDAPTSGHDVSGNGHVPLSNGHGAIGMGQHSASNGGRGGPFVSSAIREYTSLDLCSGKDATKDRSRAPSMSDPLLQQVRGSRVRTFQNPVLQTVTEIEHHINGDVPRSIPPPPPPRPLSAPQQAHHGQYAQLTPCMSQSQHQPVSSTPYGQRSQLEYQQAQGGYCRTVSQSTSDKQYRSLQFPGVHQSPMSARDVARLMAQEVARKYIQSDAPVRQQWPPPPSQLAAPPQSHAALASAPRRDSFEYSYNLSGGITSSLMQRFRIEQEEGQGGDAATTAGQIFPTQSLQGMGSRNVWRNKDAVARACYQAAPRDGCSFLGSESRLWEYDHGGGGSTTAAPAEGAPYGSLPNRQCRSMGMDGAGLLQMPISGRSMGINATAHSFGVLGGTAEADVPIPQLEWLAGTSGHHQPGSLATPLTNDNLESSPSAAGPSDIPRTHTACCIPDLSGTHASSDELSTFSWPAMFDFLDEVQS